VIDFSFFFNTLVLHHSTSRFDQRPGTRRGGPPALARGTFWHILVNRIRLSIGLLWIVSCVILLNGLPCARASGDTTSEERIKVFVSILPQAYFAERIGGERVNISVMVGPGQSPATYEPRPKQMAELSQAKLYFRIGVPFESVWIKRISEANPVMRVIDTRRGIRLLPMQAHDHLNTPADGAAVEDPHIWLSPRLVKIQAENIADALTAADPAHAAYYKDNLKALQNDLDKLDQEIVRMLSHLKTRKFMVFHPAWGYFAHDYGLEQRAIEIEGKEPSAKSLAHLIEEAKHEDIKVIFVQKQFSKESAEAVARSIGGRVVRVDPLARDYLSNMREIAGAFAEVLQ
jgi:zinc transport system substrate-binding protein